ncbi:hypothetical protein BC834DRAFT_974780 [Gloeopeniophorella convolvens]|nr:hypothetical protein BC834DRAFT_974780 [Gloeopeniophorella convolvens]
MLDTFNFYRLGTPGPTETAWAWAGHPLIQDLYLTRGPLVADILLHSPSFITPSYLDAEYGDDEYELVSWPCEDVNGLSLALKRTDRVREINLSQCHQFLHDLFATTAKPAPHLGAVLTGRLSFS